MKRYLMLGLVMMLGISAFSAPLRNIEVRLVQPDGQVVNCFASGDEFYNYLHDANGFTIVQGEDGYYVYAIKDALGNVVPSTYVVGRVDPAEVGLQPYAKISQKEYYARRRRWEAGQGQRTTKTGQRITDKGKLDPVTRTFPNGRELNHGLYNNLVVFIRFAGDTYHNTPFSTVEEMFNADDYDANSLHNYYHHTSYNQLDLWSHFYPQPDGETVLSYEDIYPKQYYQPYDPVTNPIGYQDEERTEREFSLLERAINFIEDMVPEDLNLDYNDDGLVDNVVFVCKGETGEWNSLLWPHRWNIFDRYVPLHNLQVYDFNLQLEQGGYFNVSTLCHEMCHSLSAPDLYHYVEGGPDPVGSWDLMCGTTEPPQQTSTYMKYKYGNWVDEIPVIDWQNPDANGHYELEPVSWEGGRRNGFLIPVTNDQYFFVEYRDKNNLFEHMIPGSGLLIYRIDTRFDGNAGWNGNDYLDEVYLFRPGGTPTAAGNLDHAHFSQESGRTSFNYNTDPYPFINNQPYQFYDPGFEITNISGTGDRMSFDILLSPDGEGGGPLIENFNVHVNSIDHQLEFSWNAMPNADYYKLFCDGSGISVGITDTTFVFPYTEADNGYHDYSVMYVTGGMMHIYHAETHTWAILGNYETINIDLSCDSPYGTKGGELEVAFSDPKMKTQYLTIYEGTQAHAELHVPANIEVTFRWLPGFDTDSQGIHVEARHANANGQGELFNIDAPTEGTLATYTASDSGLGFIAPQHLTASAEGDALRLQWTMPAENNHFAIFRDGIRIPVEVNGYEFFDDQLARSGTYHYHVECLNGATTGWHADNGINWTVMTWYCEPPQNLQGTHYPTYNALEWDAPQFVGHGMLAYDDNVYAGCVDSENHEWGIKIEPEQLAWFEGLPLTHIELYDIAASNYTFKIYNGANANNGSLLFTQQKEMTGSHEMVRFALDEAVSYDASLPLWITAKAPNSDFPCCRSVDNPNSCLVKVGSSWKPFTNYGFDYSWLIRAYTAQGNFERDFTYNLYWGEEECADHEMVLGQEALPSTNTTHEANGNMRYQVCALWNGKMTGMSHPVYLGPSVDVEEHRLDDGFAYYSNGNLIITGGNGTLQVIDLTGRIVLRRDGACTVSTTGMAPGVYVLRLINGSDVKTQKIVIR